MARNNDAPAPEPAPESGAPSDAATDPTPVVDAEPDHPTEASYVAEPAPETAPAPVLPVAYDPPPSYLERVRANRTGSLAAALLVAMVAALLLAILVPTSPNLFALSLLGVLLTAAVGFTVRYLAHDHGLLDQAYAFVATVIGVHVMVVTGTFDGIGSSGLNQLLELVGGSGPGYDDALLAGLASPAISTGGVLAGLVAAIIVGWGPRERREDDARHAARHASR